MNPNDLAASRPLLPAASTASGVATDSTLHFLRKDDAAESNGIGVVNAFAVVLVLAGLVFWMLRRRGFAQRRGGEAPWQRLMRGPESGGLKVLQSTRLTQKASAHVLEWGQARWLVVCNDGATTVVASQAADATDSEPPPGAAR